MKVKSSLSSLRHSIWVRITHWIITISFISLAITGFVILMCHPRLYWGDVGNDLTPALLELPISRNYKHDGWDGKASFNEHNTAAVSASRTYEIFNENGWGRSLHFLSAWFLVIPGLIYLLHGVLSRHLKRHIVPSGKELRPVSLLNDLRNHLRLRIPKGISGPQYGSLQKSSYFIVIFVFMPVIVATGLTMSPAVVAGYPILLKLFGGVQSARTVHFFISTMLVMFFVVHIAMIVLSGFKRQIIGMTFGKIYEKGTVNNKA